METLFDIVTEALDADVPLKNRDVFYFLAGVMDGLAGGQCAAFVEMDGTCAVVAQVDGRRLSVQVNTDGRKLVTCVKEDSSVTHRDFSLDELPEIVRQFFRSPAR